jgi:hemin uptake protein HemP
MTKQERISDEAAKALKDFAPGMSITSAILEMSKRVKSDESWAEFEAHVIKAVNEANRRNVATVTENPEKSVTPATKPIKPVTQATGFKPAGSDMIEFKGKKYVLKTNEQGNYILDDLQMKHIVKDGKVIQ